MKSTVNTTSLRTCDIVMKGGITSGVVYPKAVARLAKRFRFCNIGGTSAGAIAAAFTGAAEFRRKQDATDVGFNRIDLLATELATNAPNSKLTRLFLLFLPSPQTKNLFELFTTIVGSKGTIKKIVNGLRVSLRKYGPFPGFFAFRIFLVIALVLAANIGWQAAVTFSVPAALLLIVVVVLSVAVRLLLDFVGSVPQNYLGLCSGMTADGGPGDPGREPLTQWLTNEINETAGLKPSDAPLTFGQLNKEEINVEMLTTNLTHGRPYRLPFPHDEGTKENRFYFRESDFRQLFPRKVVEWLIANPRPNTATQGSKQWQETENDRNFRRALGFHPMPAAADLPVVVATRMSLSFPGLLSAIPLYMVDYDSIDQRLNRCWFTDGGFCSNFPLHFFDGPIPKRPTFSIDLTQKPEGTPANEMVPEMDPDNDPNLFDRWNLFDIEENPDKTAPPKEKGNFGKLMGFVGAMMETTRTWNDATLGRLPGYRDRIVRVPLTPAQGGLNLEMPTCVVDHLAKQGQLAAEKLLEHFDIPATEPVMTWENHRWIRLRSFMALFESMTNEVVETAGNAENGDDTYLDWLKQLKGDAARRDALSYEPSRRQIEAMIDVLEALETLRTKIRKAKNADVLQAKAPRPRPVLRPRPRI